MGVLGFSIEPNYQRRALRYTGCFAERERERAPGLTTLGCRGLGVGSGGSVRFFKHALAVSRFLAMALVLGSWGSAHGTAGCNVQVQEESDEPHARAICFMLQAVRC